MGATGTTLPAYNNGACNGLKSNVFSKQVWFSQLSELISIKEKIQYFTKTHVLPNKFLPEP